MRVGELLEVGDELAGDLAVAEAGTPGSEVHLVHAHGGVVRVARGPLLEPGGVVPLIAARLDARRGRRRDLGHAGHGVGLLDPLPDLREDLELVRDARLDARDEELPDAVPVEAAHRVLHAVPAVEAADDADGPGVRRPDREGDAPVRLRDAPVLPVVCAEDVPEALVAALAEEVEVEVAHGREEAVGVVARPGAAVGVARLDLVVLQAEHVRALPDAVGHVGERDAGAGGEDHGHGLRQGRSARTTTRSSSTPSIATGCWPRTE